MDVLTSIGAHDRPQVIAGRYTPERADAIQKTAEAFAGSMALKATVYDPSVEADRIAFANIASEAERAEARGPYIGLPHETAKKPRTPDEILVDVVNHAQKTGQLCVALEMAPSANLQGFWQSVNKLAPLPRTK